jgi:hypothetical protein
MSARSKLSRAVLHFLLLAAFLLLVSGSAPAQDKLKVEIVPECLSSTADKSSSR